jgi:RHS repeat-associated protein
VLTINGRAFTTIYDAASSPRMFTYETPENRQRTIKVDAQGRVTESTIAGLHPVRFEYDPVTKLLAAIKQGVAGVDERVYQLGYDDKRRVTSIDNPLPDPALGLSYDNADRVTTQTLPNTKLVQFGYDLKGNLRALTPPDKPVHEFEHSAVNLESKYLPPDPTPLLAFPDTEYQYNLDRQLTRIVRPMDGLPKPEVVIAYEPATNRLAAVTLPGTEGQLTYSYHATGQLGSIAGPAGETVSYVYNGFLPIKETWTGEVSGNVTHAYDSSFRVISQKVNGGHEATFTYDDDDLLETITVNGSTLTFTRATDRGGLILGATVGGPTGLNEVRTYNLFGELASHTVQFNGTDLYAVTYDMLSGLGARDGLGRITRKTETIGGVTTVFDYTYDSVGRLTTVNATGGATYSATYAYDANGNRTAAPNLPPGTSVYDAQDRLVDYGSTHFTYTPNGELASKGATTYEYDALGNLRQVDAGAIAYVIDGRLRRVGRKIGGNLQTGYLYEDQLRVVAELDGGGQVVSRFVHGTKANVPELIVKAGVTHRIVTDQLGSPRLVVNIANGDIAQRIDYDEYGIVTQDTSPGLQPFGFAGGLRDTATSLVRFGARDYDVGIGRWFSRDPAGFVSREKNLYAYANSAPVNFTDTSGKGPILAGACQVAVAAKSLYDFLRDAQKLEDALKPLDGDMKALRKPEIPGGPRQGPSPGGPAEPGGGPAGGPEPTACPLDGGQGGPSGGGGAPGAGGPAAGGDPSADDDLAKFAKELDLQRDKFRNPTAEGIVRGQGPSALEELVYGSLACGALLAVGP